MSFILRHKFTYLAGILFGVLNFFYFKFIPKDMDALMSAVLTLAATLTAIFIGFVSILLSLNKNELFKNLFLDLKIIESLMLGTTFYLLLSFISIIGFFITIRKNLFMSIWFTLLGLSVGITVSLMIQLFKILHGLWTQRQNNNDLYN